MLAIAGVMILAVGVNAQVMNGAETSCTPGTGSGDVTPVHVERTGTPPALQGSTDGETAGGMVTRVSDTFGGAGDYKAQSQGGFQQGQIKGPSTSSFGDDTMVGDNESNLEFFHNLVSDSNGTLWGVWTENDLGDHVQIYSSNDGGLTWTAYGYIASGSAEFRDPSVAVGEGTAGDVLLIAYIVDDGVSMPFPEVATVPLSGFTYTIQTIPHYGAWEGYANPVIYTDSHKFSGWYAYLTCEGIYDSVVKNINVCFWRCTDGGSTWSTMLTIYGNSDPDEWIDPDLAYGCSMNRLFLTVYHGDDSTIQYMTSDDEGITWTTSSTIWTISPIPNNPVDPEIEAAVNLDNVMVCCTRFYDLNDDLGQGYSKDGGATWTPLYSMNGYRPQDEFAASLTANEGGGSFHVACTSGQDHSVFYSHRPQDLSVLWVDEFAVDDERMAGSQDDFSKKGIASDWDTDKACIIWSDSRDTGSVSDMDTFADCADNTGISLDNTVIPETTGASIHFTLDAGPAKAGRNYVLLGSVSGQSPGTPLPGGYAVLPLNWDILTDVMFELINGPAFQNFLGTLDGNGMATATLNAPPLPGFANVALYFAFCINNPFDYASNCQIIWIVP
jgi:hypothetical protein